MSRPSSQAPSEKPPSNAPTGERVDDTLAVHTLRTTLMAYGRGLTLDDIVRIATLVEFERRAGSIVHTARALGIGRTTLYRRLASYNVQGRGASTP